LATNHDIFFFSIFCSFIAGNVINDQRSDKHSFQASIYYIIARLELDLQFTVTEHVHFFLEPKF